MGRWRLEFGTGTIRWGRGVWARSGVEEIGRLVDLVEGERGGRGECEGERGT